MSAGWTSGKTKAKRSFSGSRLILHIEDAEQQAHSAGFHIAAHALNRAKNALGWEMAGDLDQAAKAARDNFPKY